MSPSRSTMRSLFRNVTDLQIELSACNLGIVSMSADFGYLKTLLRMARKIRLCPRLTENDRSVIPDVGFWERSAIFVNYCKDDNGHIDVFWMEDIYGPLSLTVDRELNHDMVPAELAACILRYLCSRAMRQAGLHV